jgi:hypothetical protein
LARERWQIAAKDGSNVESGETPRLAEAEDLP